MTAFGSAPHHERVLAVVLVVEDAQREGQARIDLVTPDSPHWEAFWQDIGRPQEGPERTPEAPKADECVQRACPTDAKASCEPCEAHLLLAEGMDPSRIHSDYYPCGECGHDWRSEMPEWRDTLDIDPPVVWTPTCPCGEPAPPGAKPCTFEAPCAYARGKYWPGTADRVPDA